MGAVDQAQRAARDAADPERAEIRRLEREQRRGKPGSAAWLGRQRRIDAWRTRELERKARAAEAAQAATDTDTAEER